MEYWKNKELADIEGEVWKPIHGYDSLLASNFGRIKTLKSRKGSVRIKRQFTLPTKKYLYCFIIINGKTEMRSVHRLIAIAFHYRSDFRQLTVNHINGEHTDNRSENLEFCTTKENISHAIATGLTKIKLEENPRALLSNEQVLIIYAKRGKIADIAKEFNVQIAVVYSIKNGINWSELTGHQYKPNHKKLKKETVLEIFNEHTLSYQQIADKYGVGKSAVVSIKVGRNCSLITGKIYAPKTKNK